MSAQAKPANGFSRFAESRKERRQAMNGEGCATRFARLESDMSFVKRDIIEIKGELKDIRADMNDFPTVVRDDIKDLRTDMRTDFRLMFGALISVAVTLAGIMARGFNWR